MNTVAMPQRLLTSTDDCGLLPAIPWPECRSDGDGMVPALFEREDDEAAGDSVPPSNSADPTMAYEMTQQE